MEDVYLITMTNFSQGVFYLDDPTLFAENGQLLSLNSPVLPVSPGYGPEFTLLSYSALRWNETNRELVERVSLRSPQSLFAAFILHQNTQISPLNAVKTIKYLTLLPPVVSPGTHALADWEWSVLGNLEWVPRTPSVNPGVPGLIIEQPYHLNPGVRDPVELESHYRSIGTVSSLPLIKAIMGRGLMTSRIYREFLNFKNELFRQCDAEGIAEPFKGLLEKEPADADLSRSNFLDKINNDRNYLETPDNKARLSHFVASKRYGQDDYLLSESVHTVFPEE